MLTKSTPYYIFPNNLKLTFLTAAVRLVIEFTMSSGLTNDFQQKLETDVNSRLRSKDDGNVTEAENEIYNAEHD